MLAAPDYKQGGGILWALDLDCPDYWRSGLGLSGLLEVRIGIVRIIGGPDWDCPDCWRSGFGLSGLLEVRIWIVRIVGGPDLD